MNIWEWAGVSLAVLVVWYAVRWCVGYRYARVIGRVSRRIREVKRG